MGDFKLSAVLKGHSSDVRAVALPTSDLAITASRDGTTKFWKPNPAGSRTFESTETSHSAAYRTCLTYFPPTKAFSEGLIISGGQDTIIEARQPSSTVEKNADGLMIGHSNQVCSLDVNVEQGWIVSGSWDGTAKLWHIGRWEPAVEFQGHQGAVWAVVAYNQDIVVTGCADQSIRVFNIDAKLMANFAAKDVCRALVKIPEGHSSKGELLAATNDGVIRVWTLKGALISELHGHEAFIYSLAVLPDGQFVSSGEDRTVRIWNDTSCVQTITLPAVSVWSISTSPSGDIIAGSSDKVARIFTRDSSRLADAATAAEFSEAVQSSSIPQQTLGDLNKTDMEGPEFLQNKSGTKEGQIQLIKETDGSVAAYSWSASKQGWDKVGTVVDAAGGGKKSFEGKEYDYVFDVDIEDGKPAIKLPFNINQNPHDVASKWLQKNGLPMTYLEQTASFIVSNSQGASLGQPSGAEPEPGPDPFGTESRYRPGGAGGARSQTTSTTPKRLPQTDYLSFAMGKPESSQQQILKLNTKYSESGEATSVLSSTDLAPLDALFKELQGVKLDGKQKLTNTEALKAAFPVALRVATEWQPLSNRLAGLDLLRFLAMLSPNFATLTTPEGDIVSSVIESGVFDPAILATNTKLAMVSVRLFANLLFCDPQGRRLVDKHRDTILQRFASLIPYCARDIPLAVAVTTFYLNLAVWLTSPDSTSSNREDGCLGILEATSQLLETAPTVTAKPGDPAHQQATEPVYRKLFAIGTVLAGSKSADVKEAAGSIFGVGEKIGRLSGLGYFREARFTGLVDEVRGALR